MHTFEKYSNLPIFVSGLSLGGLIAFNVSLNKKKFIKGSVFLNPCFEDSPSDNRLAKKVIRNYGKYLPNFRLPRPFKGKNSFYNLDNYTKADPYIFSKRV